jgi:hypothetical protein
MPGFWKRILRYSRVQAQLLWKSKRKVEKQNKKKPQVDFTIQTQTPLRDMEPKKA